MKKYAILAAVLVLTVSLLAGCGCTARNNSIATMPSATQIPATTPATDAAEGTETTPDQYEGGISDDAVSEPATRNRMR